MNISTAPNAELPSKACEDLRYVPEHEILNNHVKQKQCMLDALEQFPNAHIASKDNNISNGEAPS